MQKNIPFELAFEEGTLEQKKQLLADANRWLSLFKQSNGALKSGKFKRREQLLNEMLKLARRFKKAQLEIAPASEEMTYNANLCLINSLRELGLAYYEADDNPAQQRCLPFLKEALELLESAPVEKQNVKEIFDIYDVLCSIYSASKNHAAYEDVCRRGLALKEREVGQWHYDIVSYLMDLAWALEEQHKYAECAALKKDAYAIVQNQLGASHPDTIALKHGVAYTTLLSEGVGAVEAIQKALATLTPEERKQFSGGVAAELESMR